MQINASCQCHTRIRFECLTEAHFEFSPRLSVSVVLFHSLQMQHEICMKQASINAKVHAAFDQKYHHEFQMSQQMQRTGRECICIIISFYLKISQVVTVDKKKIK